MSRERSPHVTPRNTAPEKPDQGRATAALGLSAQVDQHAQARRAAAKGSAEWHFHNEQLNLHMSHLQRVDSEMHSSVRSIVALQDRLHQSEQITMGLPTEDRRDRRADPVRRDAIARDRANLRAAKDLLSQRGSAGIVRKPKAQKSESPETQ